MVGGNGEGKLEGGDRGMRGERKEERRSRMGQIRVGLEKNEGTNTQSYKTIHSRL